MIPDRSGESDCEMSRVAKPITHITSCLWGNECLGVSQIQVHTLFLFFFFFLLCSSTFSSYRAHVKYHYCIHPGYLNRLYFGCACSCFKMRPWLPLWTDVSFSIHFTLSEMPKNHVKGRTQFARHEAICTLTSHAAVG